MYMHGPWLPGLPTQGYQLPLAPREVYRLGIAGTNAYCQKQYGKTFDHLSAAHQDGVLQGLDGASISFDALPAKAFFEMLYANTLEGFFSDPIYGGNRNKVGWKLVGFPGAAAAYIGLVDHHNVPYKVAPMGISDVQQEAAVMNDQMGSNVAEAGDIPMHTAIAKKALGLR